MSESATPVDTGPDSKDERIVDGKLTDTYSDTLKARAVNNIAKSITRRAAKLGKSGAIEDGSTFEAGGVYGGALQTASNIDGAGTRTQTNIHHHQPGFKDNHIDTTVTIQQYSAPVGQPFRDSFMQTETRRPPKNHFDPDNWEYWTDLNKTTGYSNVRQNQETKKVVSNSAKPAIDAFKEQRRILSAAESENATQTSAAARRITNSSDKAA